MRRDLIEAEAAVGERAEELDGVDHAGLQGAEDLGRGQGHGGGAQPAVDFAAQPGGADLDPAERGQRPQRRLEPARHIGPRVPRHERLDLERGVGLVPECLPTAEPHPRAVRLR